MSVAFLFAVSMILLAAANLSGPAFSSTMSQAVTLGHSHGAADAAPAGQDDDGHEHHEHDATSKSCCGLACHIAMTSEIALLTVSSGHCIGAGRIVAPLHVAVYSRIERPPRTAGLLPA